MVLMISSESLLIDMCHTVFRPSRRIDTNICEDEIQGIDTERRDESDSIDGFVWAWEEIPDLCRSCNQFLQTVMRFIVLFTTKSFASSAFEISRGASRLPSPRQ